MACLSKSEKPGAGSLETNRAPPLLYSLHFSVLPKLTMMPLASRSASCAPSAEKAPTLPCQLLIFQTQFGPSSFLAPQHHCALQRCRKAAAVPP